MQGQRTWAWDMAQWTISWILLRNCGSEIDVGDSNLNLSYYIKRIFWRLHTLFGYYNLLVRIINLVSHTTYVVCVNFIHKWRDLQFKDDSEWHIFGEIFHGSFYLLSEFLPEIWWVEIAEEIFFVFCFQVWPEARTLAFRVISQYIRGLVARRENLRNFS